MVSEVPMQTAPDHSPNQPVTVGQQGNAMVNNIRLTVPLSAISATSTARLRYQ